MPNATLYTLGAHRWSRAWQCWVRETGKGVRWYGAVTRLWDSRMLVTSGLDRSEGGGAPGQAMTTTRHAEPQRRDRDP
jgi:hypothetical protein